MRGSLLARVVTIVCAAPLLGGCGSDAAGGPTTVLPATESTPFSTVTTSSTLPATTVAPTSPTPSTPPAGVIDYVVKSGDVLVNIARAHGTTAEAIAQLNGWSDGINHVIYEGLTIKVPSSVAPPPADSTTAPPPTQSTAPPDPCAQGTYTITEDDTSRLKVAEKVGTTVDALDAANADTPGYSAFYPGLVIKLPKKAGC